MELPDFSTARARLELPAFSHLLTFSDVPAVAWIPLDAAALAWQRRQLVFGHFPFVPYLSNENINTNFIEAMIEFGPPNVIADSCMVTSGMVFIVFNNPLFCLIGDVSIYIGERETALSTIALLMFATVLFAVSLHS